MHVVCITLGGEGEYIHNGISCATAQHSRQAQRSFIWIAALCTHVNQNPVICIATTNRKMRGLLQPTTSRVTQT